jgi:transcriptional regulator with XRE-family HTH domain
MKELFGQRLREQRLKQNLTLEQLAEKANLSPNYVGMVERGLKEPGLATIVKLLNGLNIGDADSPR